MSQISLTASMRSNLLSLQGISGQVSLTQNRLSTGLKINSAIDNPANYYAANSLNNRAADLGALLDSMGQAVQTVKAANETIESAAKFLEQAASVAAKALETNKIPAKSWFESKIGANGAVVTTAQELKDAVAAGKSTIVVYGKLDYFENQSITLKTNQQLVGTEYFTGYTGKQKFSELNLSGSISLNNSTVSDLAINVKAKANGNFYSISCFDNSKLNDIDLNSNINSDNNIFTSGIIAYNNVDISGNININHQASSNIINCYGIYNHNNATISSTANLNTSSIMLGLSTLNIISGRVNLNDKNTTTGNSGLSINKGNLFVGKDAELNIENKSFTINASGCSIEIQGRVNLSSPYIGMSISNSSVILTESAVLSVSSQANGIRYNNSNITFMTGSRVNLSDQSGQTNLVSKNDKIYPPQPTYQFLSPASLAADPAFVDSGMAIDWDNWHPADSINIQAKDSTDQSQYSTILAQYDNLIKDSSYKGVNLLKGDNLNVKFDGQGESKLEVTGKNLSSATLGLTTKDWQTQGDIAKSLAEIATALKGIRSFSAELGNNYSIITTRQDFTENLINVLTEGADKLTLADMNEESANMLALQTRQQLAINSLSLASQAAQSVLKLF